MGFGLYSWGGLSFPTSKANTLRMRSRNPSYCAVLVAVVPPSLLSADVLHLLHSFHLVLICRRVRDEGETHKFTTNTSLSINGLVQQRGWGVLGGGTVRAVL